MPCSQLKELVKFVVLLCVVLDCIQLLPANYRFVLALTRASLERKCFTARKPKMLSPFQTVVTNYGEVRMYRVAGTILFSSSSLVTKFGVNFVLRCKVELITDLHEQK